MQVMAAYIDQNPVRAGLVEGAEEYRWSGWGAAMAGEKEAVAGLCDVVGCGLSQWEGRGREAYGMWVSEKRRQVRTKKAKGDQMPDDKEQPGLIDRVRAFSVGLAVGSEAFVEEVFDKHRDLFGVKRNKGARPLDARGGLLSGALHALRDLRRGHNN